MADGNPTLSHIDGNQFDLWLPGLLGIKGDPTKPQEWDTSKAVAVVDLTQGGFANEDEIIQSRNNSYDLSGQSNILFHPGVSCRYSAGGLPATADANTRPTHARIASASMGVYLTAAGVASLTNRYIVLSFGLTRDDGVQLFVQNETMLLYDKIAFYYSNLKNLIIPPGSEFVMRVYLQPAYAGAAGGVNFPEGTLGIYNSLSYKKPLGGQLPL